MSDQLTVVLNQELAVKMSEPQFTALMQNISAYEVQSTNVRVTNDVEYQLGADSLVAIAEVAKSLEHMRKGIVAYPNTFVKTVNDMFRGLKDRCVKTRQRIEYHVVSYKQKKDAAFAQQQAAEAAAAQEQMQLPLDADTDEAPPEPPQPPLQSTKASNGRGSVSYRKGKPTVEVLNPAKLVRASLSEKNKVPTDVISIDAAALRRAVDAGIYTVKQWEKYGVKVTETQETVVRT